MSVKNALDKNLILKQKVKLLLNIYIVTDKFDDLTHPGETKTEKVVRKTKEFVEDLAEDAKEAAENIKEKITG